MSKSLYDAISVAMACGANLSQAQNKIAKYMKIYGDVAHLNTVGSKTVAMFGGFGPIVMQRLTVWKSRLVLVE